MRNPKPQRRWMQLGELVIAAALALGIAGSSLKMMLLCWDFCRDTGRQTQRCQEITLLRRAWRDFVRDCPEGLWVDDDGTLYAGACQARGAADALILIRPERRREIKLPARMRAEVASEVKADGADCLVLNLAWESQTLEKIGSHRVRIVACP